MRAVIASLAFVAIAFAAGGCSEGACEQAEKAGKATHACYLENKKAEREARESEVELNRLKGVSAADEEQEARKEFREGWEEAEREAEFYGE